MDVGRRGLFQLLGAASLGVAATTITKVLPKQKLKPFKPGQVLTAAHMNEIIERINNG